jgi:TonB family protein
MSNDSPPGSRPSAGGEFAWPPTSDELDAIEVIPLDDTSSVKAIAPVTKAIVAAPVLRRRRRRWHPPRREDLVYLGVTLASVLAIAIAAVEQLSDWPHAFEPRDPANAPVAPLTTTSLPLTSPAATTSSLADLALMRLLEQPPDVARAALAANADPVTALAKGVSPTVPRKAEAPARRASRAAERRRAAASAPETFARRANYTGRANYTAPRLIAPESGRRGKLVLWVEIRKNGKVGDVDVLSSDLDRKNRSHRDLQRAAISTVKRWRYTPAVRDGAPTESRVRVVVDINLDSAGVAFTEAGARRRAAAADRAADSVLAAR